MKNEVKAVFLKGTRGRRKGVRRESGREDGTAHGKKAIKSRRGAAAARVCHFFLRFEIDPIANMPYN